MILNPRRQRGRPLSHTTPSGSVLLARARGAALCLSIMLALAGCGGDEAPTVLALRGATMGTSYSVQLVEPPAALDRAALGRRIETLLDAINGLMSTYRSDSELSRFNAREATDWQPVSRALVAVVEAAQAVSRASDGAFDVTVGPLVNLWGFGPTVTAEALPSPAEIERARARVGWERLALQREPPALRKDRPDLYVDLSAIAKGYAVDRLAQLLEDAGIEDYLVEVGGELRGRGVNGRGQPWRIAIERPDAARRAVFRVVALRDLGMATSGDYRNFFEVDGDRFSHTIDPATGRPVRHRLASVTVLAESTMVADAWATALLVLGPERGMALAEAHGLAALFIEHQSDGGLDADASPAFVALTSE